MDPALQSGSGEEYAIDVKVGAFAPGQQHPLFVAQDLNNP